MLQWLMRANDVGMKLAKPHNQVEDGLPHLVGHLQLANHSELTFN